MIYIFVINCSTKEKSFTKMVSGVFNSKVFFPYLIQRCVFFCVFFPSIVIDNAYMTLNYGVGESEL